MKGKKLYAMLIPSIKTNKFALLTDFSLSSYLFQILNSIEKKRERVLRCGCGS